MAAAPVVEPAREVATAAAAERAEGDAEGDAGGEEDAGGRALQQQLEAGFEDPSDSYLGAAFGWIGGWSVAQVCALHV